MQTLEGAVRRCEQLQEEGRSKDSEVRRQGERSAIGRKIEQHV